MNKTKQQIEEVIKKNLPEKKDDDGFAQDPSVAFNNGFDEALSQINTSLIADEVLKVVVEKIENLDNDIYGGYEEFARQGFNRCKYKILQLLTNSSNLEGEQSEHLSPKENKNNE